MPEESPARTVQLDKAQDMHALSLMQYDYAEKDGNLYRIKRNNHTGKIVFVREREDE